MIKKGYTVSIFLITIILVSSSGCIQRRDMIEVDGENRSFILHVPSSYSEGTPTPLVVVFHGGGGNAENIEKVTGFSEKADEGGFLVVYPEGSGRFQRRLLTWNAGFCCGYALEQNMDDITFVKLLIQHLMTQYSIDESMIFATGISNGGIMTYRVGAELSDIFAAIAPVAAQIGGKATVDDDMWIIPEPSYPVSVLAINGMNDTRVPYYGGRPLNNDTHVYWWMSVNDSIGFWVNQNMCEGIPNRNISESGNIIIESYSCGKNNSEVVLVSIVNGNHSWPGGKIGWKNGDEPTQEISATDMIWEFFQSHSKV